MFGRELNTVKGDIDFSQMCCLSVPFQIGHQSQSPASNVKFGLPQQELQAYSF